MEKDNIKLGFDKMLNINTKIKRKRNSVINKKKNLFISMITKYEIALVNSLNIQTQFNIDLSKYEEPFYNVIDESLLLGFGDNIYNLISFYFYERINPDGSYNPYIDNNEKETWIYTPDDLYNFIIKNYPDTFK